MTLIIDRPVKQQSIGPSHVEHRVQNQSSWRDGAECIYICLQCSLRFDSCTRIPLYYKYTSILLLSRAYSRQSLQRRLVETCSAGLRRGVRRSMLRLDEPRNSQYINVEKNNAPDDRDLGFQARSHMHVSSRQTTPTTAPRLHFKAQPQMPLIPPCKTKPAPPSFPETPRSPVAMCGSKFSDDGWSSSGRHAASRSMDERAATV